MLKSGEYRWIQSIGSGFKNSEGKVIRVAGAHSDIHEKKTQEEELKKLAFFDPLTGLVNRSQIIKRFKLEIEKKDMLAAFIFIDLDNFKMLNDSL